VKVVITEAQYKMVLNEKFDLKLNSIVDHLSKLTNKIVNDVKKQFKLSTRFALTYGAGIGALMNPVSQYLHNEFTGLEDWQISSLVIAAISIVYYQGEDYMKMKKDIESQGLEDELKAAVDKTVLIKERFADMLNLVGLSVYTAKDILAYTFLLPVLGMLVNVVTTFGANSVEFTTLIESILTSGLITTSGVVVRDVLQKIAKTISGKSSSLKDGDDIS